MKTTRSFGRAPLLEEVFRNRAKNENALALADPMCCAVQYSSNRMLQYFPVREVAQEDVICASFHFPFAVLYSTVLVVLRFQNSKIFHAQRTSSQRCTAGYPTSKRYSIYLLKYSISQYSCIVTNKNVSRYPEGRVMNHEQNYKDNKKQDGHYTLFVSKLMKAKYILSPNEGQLSYSDSGGHPLQAS